MDRHDRTAAVSDRHWFLGKIPFDEGVFEAAAHEITTALHADRGGGRKLIIVDLDNTMWGEVVGDTGWEGLRLGGHDGVGEAFVEFQRCLQRLQRRGIALAIVSKNEEATALEAIDLHPAMVLRRSDFVAWRINWLDKAQNIVDLVADLNLGLQSVVFIDDNPHERSRVRSALTEVLVPDWPTDPMDYVRAIESLTCFDAAATTSEDRARTEMYQVENKRQELREEIGDLDTWIRELDVVVTAEPLNRSNVARATQLLNKTNQMNLATRRLSEAEFTDWANDNQNTTLCVAVSDRMGDAGLTGLVSLRVVDETATLVDFVLSCRVMGRRVEEAMTYIAGATASRMGATSIIADFLPTAKNLPCRRYFERSAFEVANHDRYFLDLLVPLVPPSDVTVSLLVGNAPGR